MNYTTMEALAPSVTARPPAPPVHPLATNARVLLTSVFGPYAQDDEYGSRAVNPMELYHNQVTRVQGVFSLRMFHRSWGLMLIQANLDAPCTLLDFPTLDRFVKELQTVRYDVIGISAILPNVVKVAKMCALIREHQPDATIVVGGHAANHPRLSEWIDADHIVRGEGVRWFREYLGEDAHRPIRHPLILSAVETRTLGVRLPQNSGDTAATLIPSVGCPIGCNFCSTSAMFGGKGRSVDFYESGDDLFALMSGFEAEMGVQSFFVMDENFLLRRKRALRLLELMRAHDKAWSLYVFSSANTLRRYSMDELVGLGVSWVWVGLEGKGSAYDKLKGTDTRSLVDTLQSHGIRVLGSSIVGLPEHAPENIDEVIDHAVAHDTEFHQFMLYTPLPGTPLHAEHLEGGTLLGDEECPPADTHGQLRFNFRHPHIRNGEETEFLVRAFERDFERNGPSILRIARTLLRGWQKHKNHPEARIRKRYRRECQGLSTVSAGSLWAAERWFRSNPLLVHRIAGVREALVSEFGIVSRLAGPVIGTFLLAAMHREAWRLRRGRAYEPPTFYETNQPRERADRRAPSPCRWILPAGVGGAEPRLLAEA
jgi:radical SAM superfamily enzyme YgiQ (UPF0313 family)